MTVLTARFFDGSPVPLATVGFSSNFVPAVIAGTGPSTSFGGGAADVAEADGDGDALALLEEESLSPHPAIVTSPAGTARRRERRRTVKASYRSILLMACAQLYGARRAPYVKRTGPVLRSEYVSGRRYPDAFAYIPAISFSTRSSTERNGSLHNTVRWAWSLSLRWTQSTVKSRRCSWALRMKSPGCPVHQA